MILTDQQYFIFRDRVLAAVGESSPNLIHRINGKLALVGDGSRHARNAKTRGEEAEAAKIEASVDDALREIAIAVHVHP